MKPVKTNLLATVFPFAVGALLIAMQSCFTGCAKITYKQGNVEVTSIRAFWKTESYIADVGTNGTAKLEVNKSGADAKAIVDIINATATAAGAALK